MINYVKPRNPRTVEERLRMGVYVPSRELELAASELIRLARYVLNGDLYKSIAFGQAEKYLAIS